MTYTYAGQLGLIVSTEDGEQAAPERVAAVCSECGALVLATMTNTHDASHR